MAWTREDDKTPRPSAASLRREQRRGKSQTDANRHADWEVQTVKDMEKEYENAISDSEESLPELRLQPLSTSGRTDIRTHDRTVHGQASGAQAMVPKSGRTLAPYHGSETFTSAQQAQLADAQPAIPQTDWGASQSRHLQASDGEVLEFLDQDESYFPNFGDQTSLQLGQAPPAWKAPDDSNVYGMTGPPQGQQGTSNSSMVNFPNVLPLRGGRDGSDLLGRGGILTENAADQDWSARQGWQQSNKADTLTRRPGGQAARSGTGWGEFSQIEIGPFANNPTTNLDFLSLDQTGQAGSDPGWNRFHLHGEPGGTPGGQGNWADDLYPSLSGTAPAATIKPEHAINPLVNDPSWPFGVSDDTLLGFTYPYIPDTAFGIQDTYTGNQFGDVRPTVSSLQGQHQISNDLAIPSFRVTQYETNYETNAGPWSPFGTDALPETYHIGPFGYDSNFHPSGSRSVGPYSPALSAPPSPSLTAAYSVSSCPDFSFLQASAEPEVPGGNVINNFRDSMTAGASTGHRDTGNPNLNPGSVEEAPQKLTNFQPTETRGADVETDTKTGGFTWMNAGSLKELHGIPGSSQVRTAVMRHRYATNPDWQGSRPTRDRSRGSVSKPRPSGSSRRKNHNSARSGSEDLSKLGLGLHNDTQDSRSQGSEGGETDRGTRS